MTKSFLKNFFSLFLRSLVLKAGAKVQPFFYSTKTFLKKFFSLFFELSSLFESGCKSTTFFWTDKMFLKKNSVYFNELAPFLKAGAKVLQLFELTKYFVRFFLKFLFVADCQYYYNAYCPQIFYIWLIMLLQFTQIITRSLPCLFAERTMLFWSCYVIFLYESPFLFTLSICWIC